MTDVYGQAMGIGTVCKDQQKAIAFTSFFDGSRDITVAHEIGHLLGGTHEFSSNRIMATGVPNRIMEFSGYSKSQIGNFINSQTVQCFSTVTGLGDKIEGADFICDINPVQYYTYDFPQGLIAAYWNVSNSSNIQVEQVMGNSIDKVTFKVTKISDGVGTFTLSYIISAATACSMQVFTKTINLGKPTPFEITIEQTSYNCIDLSDIMVVTGGENATEFRWEYQDPITRQWIFLDNSPPSTYFYPNWFSIPFFSNWYRNARRGACLQVGFRLTANNMCGTTNAPVEQPVMLATFCKSPGGNIYCRQAQTDSSSVQLSIFPNPTDAIGVVTIALQDANYEVADGTPNYEISINNNMGQVVKQVTATQLENKIELQDLPNGLYVVKVVYKNQVVTQKLVVQK